MKSALLALLLLPLAASADNERLPYACDNGSHIGISFSANSDGRPQATLHFADEAITLPQVPAASGTLYRNETLRLHTKEERALFEDDKGNRRDCLRGNTPPPGAASPSPVAASSFVDIAGSVSYLQRIALPPDAVLIVRIQDTARAGAPARTLAEQRIELAGQQVPINFQTTIDRDLIGKRARITISARIESRGKLLFINDRSYPVLTDGPPNPVDMRLKPVARGPRR